MKKLLNSLYITKDNVYLSKEGENIVILESGKVIARYPIHIFESILCFNYTGVSPELIKMCIEKNVLLSFFTPYGKFCGRIIGTTNGNVLVRKKQYRISETNESLDFTRNIIYAKAYNSRKILLRVKIDHFDKINAKKMEKSIKIIEENMIKIKNSYDKDSIRGLEGVVAKAYFNCFDEMILKQKDIFRFNTRNKRPPKDMVNAMLSFLYSILSHDVQSALEGVGIDSYVGFFHTDRPGRISMALDLMEELRGFLVDRLVLTLINRNEITEKCFEIKENDAVLLNEKGRNIVIKAYQNRKNDNIMHPYLKENIKIGLLPYVQALLLNRYLREDIDGYPPFMLKEW